MVTVGIVLYKNETQALSCVDSLLRYTANLPLQFIFINNAPPSKSLEAFKDELKKRNLSSHILQNSQNNIATARNLILDNCSSPYLYYTDPDCQVRGSSLTKFEKFLDENPTTAGVGSFNSPPESHPLKDLHIIASKSVWGHFSSAQMQSGPPMPQQVNHLPTCHVLYRVSFLRELGGFHPMLNEVGEDLELSFRICQQNYKLYFVPDEGVDHDLPQTLLQWTKKVFHYGRAQILVFFLNKSILKSHRLLPLMLVPLIGGILTTQPFAILFLILLHIVISTALSFKASKNIKQVIRFALFCGLTHGAYTLGQCWELGRQLVSKVFNLFCVRPSGVETSISQPIKKMQNKL